MARDTQYTLYKTGRIDPTFQNIWAFSSEAQREAWFTSKIGMPVLNNKYWKVGNSIKIPVRYEESFEYDYVKIVNDSSNPELSKTWFCFITSRAYLSNNCTLLNLSVDYIQTFYFTTQVDGVSPFWAVEGFITTATNKMLPPRATASEFPVPVSSCMSFEWGNLGYAVVIYSTINLENLNTLSYRSAVIDGQYIAAAPYIMSMNITNISKLIADINEKGYTDAISGIYLIPIDYINIESLPDTPTIVTDESSLFTPLEYTVNKPTSCDGYIPKNEVLLGYDYTYFTLNNGQGEISTWHFEDFDGVPRFGSRLSFASGSPCIIVYPLNYKNFDGNEYRQKAVKVTQAPACSYLNDSYKIWLAQTQNSRSSAINGAQMAIDQAEYARSHSWAYTKGDIVKNIQGRIKQNLVGGASSLIEDGVNALGSISAAMGGTQFRAGQNNGAGADFSNPNKIKNTIDIRKSTISDSLGALYDLSMQYINHQMGIEQAYQYDFAVANAQHNLNAILAGYRDRARVPATASGSNAYGDMCVLQQYGFMIAVYTPSKEYAELIDDNLSASGHTVNKYGFVTPAHTVFDRFSVQSAFIPVNVSDRPEFVRKMMLQLLSDGIYLWYVRDGDISDRIGSPYKVDNPEVS